MKMLLHACCAPCLTYTLKKFSKDFDVTVYWFNPNIHPFKEYGRRLDAIQKFVEEKDVDVIYDDRYELRSFLEGVLRNDPRCEFCYRWRLSETARKASEENFDVFSTTLMLSPYQDHDMIKKIGGEEGKNNDIKFIYKDLTDGFYESHEMADEMGLYKQGYCGCIFSEKDRYYKKLIE
ncbi:MAG: epoxyqueuosine reductase QueH [Thermoplasmata archaeon]